MPPPGRNEFRNPSHFTVLLVTITRSMRRLSTFVVLTALLAAAAPAHAQAPAPRPNILFVMTDDQTYESLSLIHI